MQGAVERLNQTIKHKLLVLMEYHQTNRWSLYVQQVIDQYNNSHHSTIKMESADSLKESWLNRMNEETLSQKVNRLGLINKLKDAITKRGENDRQMFLRKHSNLHQYYN